jgi:hypothetical protein
MTEKRRGMATRAKVSGSAVSSFRSPIYVISRVNVSVSRLFVNRFSFPSSRAGAKWFLHQHFLFYDIWGHK